jgi:hypothetical protein
MANNAKDPHVIVRLEGGLGNQLFMYAFARSMALKNNVHLKLDIVSGFARDKTYKREYLLNHFSINGEVASDWESFHHIFGKRRRKLIISCNKFLPLAKRNYIKEQVRAFDEDIFNVLIRKSVYLDGYWQSYKYFEGIDEIIRKDFSFRFPLTDDILEEANLIRSCNAVCLGIRRFEDMPEDKRVKKKILNLDYYEKAMHIIESACPDPHFFIFTRDTDWATWNFSQQEGHQVTFIKGKDSHIGAVVDLWLMTLCRHHIISNSTLHWWGAWLNHDPHKKVVSPGSGWGNKDIIPPSWITIDS